MKKKKLLAVMSAICIAAAGMVSVPAINQSTVTAEAATNGVCKASDGNWYYYKNGVIQTSYTGFQQNSNGWWYIENGKVTFKKNSVIKGTVNGTNAWWYVVGSKVQTSFTGLADYSNENGWWYIKNGKADFTANTVAKNNNGWWYVKGGKVQFSYTGFGTNSNGSWYCEGGKVKFNKNSVIQDKTGAIGTKGTWYYVVGSKVQSSYTGVANYSNSNGWWYIKNGKVDFSFNGIASNKNGSWVVKGGKVNFSYNGTYTYNGQTYSVSGGKATLKSCSHTYDSGTVTKAATCTTAGVRTSTCSVCGAMKTESIAATGHNYVKTVTKAATCEEDGVITCTCSKCGDSYTESIAATGTHNWEVVEDTTEVAKHEDKAICSNCGAYF